LLKTLVLDVIIDRQMMNATERAGQKDPLSCGSTAFLQI